MRELNHNEIDFVAGGQLPDEDLQDMRENNPDADNWHDVVNETPPDQIILPSWRWLYGTPAGQHPLAW